MTFASVPQQKVRADGSASKYSVQQAAEHGLAAADLGKIGSDVFLASVWQLTERPRWRLRIGAGPVR